MMGNSVGGIILYLYLISVLLSLLLQVNSIHEASNLVIYGIYSKLSYEP